MTETDDRAVFKKTFAEKFLKAAGDLPHLTKDTVVDTILGRMFDKTEDAGYIAMLKAEILLADQDYEAALSFARRAYEADPANKQTREILGTCLFETGAYAQAIPFLAGMRKDYPRDEMLAFQHGFALFKAGHRRAYGLLQKVMRSYDDLVDAYPAQMKELFLAGFQALAPRRGNAQTPK